jgi:hypothetical protein
MEPPTRFAASPGTPLFPLSPERVNKLGLGAPASPKFGEPGLSLKPSLLSGSPESHFRRSRNNSGAVDPYVQGLVARFDGLSVKDYKAQSEVAIRRADMAREMAEMEQDKSRREAKALDEEVRRMREEMRKAKKEIEDGREGSRKLAKRLEAVIVCCRAYSISRIDFADIISGRIWSIKGIAYPCCRHIREGDSENEKGSFQDWLDPCEAAGRAEGNTKLITDNSIWFRGRETEVCTKRTGSIHVTISTHWRARRAREG